ncbi:MAG TPA: MaoC/PaaZ C-terminal domain-containing protein [Nocardioidaceae bacterium]|nr:MaoC/PaaZ C-terminal domain-containing protein [Nocardioidaceae bacterium]
MPDVATRELDAAPNTLGFMVKAALPALPGVSLLPGVKKSGGELPDLTLVRKGVTVDRAHVAAYAAVCGFPAKDTLPLPYPHMLAFPLHMALMTDGSFPFAAMGTVHLENVITQHRALTADDLLDVKVWAENLRKHAKGTVYDVMTEVSVDGELVWEERSSMLVRGKGDKSADVGLDIEQVPAGPTTWRLAGDLGRRYGAVSGDRNPIHLYGVTAKAFGFPRQIAHGMWSMARCVASLENRLDEAVTVEVAFKTPILLPGTVAFGSQIDDDGALFSLSNPKNGAPHLVGRAR